MAQAQPSPSLWGFRKLVSKPYPVAGAAVTHPVNQLVIDLKDYLQTAVAGSIHLFFAHLLRLAVPSLCVLPARLRSCLGYCRARSACH